MEDPFKPFNWGERIEAFFPVIPSVIDSKSRVLDRIYRNWENHKERCFKGKDCEFAWFYQTLKMVNKRFREENLFILWIWLAISRPWRTEEFLLEWKGGKEKDFSRVMNVLWKLEERYNLNFRCASDDKGFKTFYRYKKRDLVRNVIAGIYTEGYSRFISSWKLIRKQKRFCDLLKSGSLITKREYQHKLRINSEELEYYIKEAREKGFIEVRQLQKNSFGLFYKPPREKRRGRPASSPGAASSSASSARR